MSDEHPFRVEQLDSIRAVRHDDVAVLVNADSGGSDELAVTGTTGTESAKVDSLRGEDLDAVVAVL